MGRPRATAPRVLPSPDIQHRTRMVSFGKRMAMQMLRSFSASLGFGEAHPQGSIQLVDDGSVRNGLSRFILTYYRALFVNRRCHLRLCHLLCKSCLLQSHFEVMGNSLMPKSLAILLKFLGIGNIR